MPRPPVTRARPYTPASGALAGETFTSERQYRNALARSKGFRSWEARRAAEGPRVRTGRQLDRLRRSEREAHQRVGTALTLMRNDPELTVDEAARRAHTTRGSILRHGSEALVRASRGRIAAAPVDRHVRRVWFTLDDGLTTVDVAGSRAASLVARYDNAVRWYLETGDDSRLNEFRGRVLRAGGRRLPFVTDLNTLDELARRGEVSFESLYASAA